MEMKTKTALIAIMLFCTLCTLRLMADIEVEININLPLVEIKDEPVMAVIPGTNIYFIDGYEHNYFFYEGYWWRVHNNRWYRARHYNGK